MLETTPDRPDGADAPSRTRLWLIAGVAGVVLAIAAWQLRADEVRPPTATEAFNAAAAQIQGDPAPAFSISLIGGGRFDLAEHLQTDGRPVLLNLWASWCIPCRNEMPFLDAAVARNPEIFFLGVAVNDSPRNAESFVEEIGVSYPIGLDTDGFVVDAYPAPAMPVTYVIDRDGSLRGRFFGELNTERLAELLARLDEPSGS